MGGVQLERVGGGGMARDPWPIQDFKEVCGARNDKGGPLPPRHAFQRASHILCWSTQSGGRGLMSACVPPPLSDRSLPAQNAHDKTD